MTDTDPRDALAAALERARNDLLAYGMHLNGELVVRGADHQHRLPGEPCKCGLDEAIARASTALGQGPHSHRERVALARLEAPHDA